MSASEEIAETLESLTSQDPIKWFYHPLIKDRFEKLDTNKQEDFMAQMRAIKEVNNLNEKYMNNKRRMV